jgi:hypothetical protein
VSLGSNQFFSFGNLEIDGPAKVDVDFKLQRAVVAARGGFRVEPTRPSSANRSFAATESKMELRAAGVDENFRTSGIGGLLGAEISLRLVDSWTMYARADFSTVGSDADMTTFEIGMRALLRPHVGVFAGWTPWEFVDEEFESELDVKLSGPIVGLQFAF